MIGRIRQQSGFTLIEVVVVVIIIGILAGVAVKKGANLYEAAKIEETKQEMDALATAITGNAELMNNGVRSDFGYVGDVGAMPPNLDALYSNPGAYATWNGPYVGNRFTQITDDYKKDAFGANYSYGAGATITSTGSGSNMVRRLATGTGDLLLNTIAGNVYDADGTPPGPDYADSVLVAIAIPNGAGGTITKGQAPDQGGYFAFDSIPVGNHDLTIVYEPDDDTLTRFVSVIPSSNGYGEYRLPSNVWFLASDITNGLVGHWKLDESSGTSAADNAGANTGTLSNMSGSEWTSGQVDGALEFDGSNDYVGCGNGASLKITGTEITMVAWVKWDSNNAWSTIAMKTSSGAWTDGYGLYAHSNSTVNFYVTRYNQNRATAAYAADGLWHHVVGSYDGSNVRIWVDGVEGSPDSYTGSITDSNHAFEIGRGYSNSYNFDGSIDDVRIYNRALSDAEVQTLYNLGK